MRRDASHEGVVLLRRIMTAIPPVEAQFPATGRQFWRMVAPLAEMMGGAYPELVAKRGLIEQALKAEEAAFAQTLDAGMTRLENTLAASKGSIDGEQLFQLHDTYGCPPDLILDILRERDLTPATDALSDYEHLMEMQRERARGASKFPAARACLLACRLACSDHVRGLRQPGCNWLPGGRHHLRRQASCAAGRGH